MSTMVYLYIWAIVAARSSELSREWVNSGSYGSVVACEKAAKDLALVANNREYRCIPNGAK